MRNLLVRAPNKMTLHSKGLFRLWTASGCIDNAEQKPASPSVPQRKRSISELRFILIGTLIIFAFFVVSCAHEEKRKAASREDSGVFPVSSNGTR